MAPNLSLFCRVSEEESERDKHFVHDAIFNVRVSNIIEKSYNE